MNKKIQEWLTKLNEFDLFNLGVSTFIILLLIYFSLPVFVLLGLDGDYVKGHNELISTTSVYYSVIGIGMFIVGYWLIGKRLPITKPTIFNTQWKHERVLIAFITIFLAGFLTKIIRLINGSYLSHMYIDVNGPLFMVKFFASLNMFHFIALAIAFTYYYYLLKNNDPRSQLWKWVVWPTFAFEIICGLIVPGGRLAIITPIIIHLLTRHYIYRRSNLRILGAVIFMLFVLCPVKNVLRDVPSALNTYFGNDEFIFTDLRTLSKKDIFSVLATGELGDSKRYARLEINAKNTWQLAADSSIGRIGQAHTFSRIIEKTTDYFYGRNLLYVFNQVGIPNSFIEKISGIDVGTDFGLKYGLVIESLTGVGPTVMGDLYLNFGLYGILFGMLLFGILFRKLFDGMLAVHSITGIFFYSIAWIILMHGLEQSISASYGKLLQLSIILIGIHLFMTLPSSWKKWKQNGFNNESPATSNA